MWVELLGTLGIIHGHYVYVYFVHIYVQRKDSLNNLLFEESFTRYKTNVIIACAKALKVK